MPFKIDLGSFESFARRAMPAYFVSLLNWMFTLMMIFGGILCGVLLAAPRLRQSMSFLGKLADDLQPFRGFLGAATAVASLVRLFWLPGIGTVFVEDMLPGLLGAAAGVIVFIDYWKSRTGAATPTLPEPAAMGLGIGAAVICFVHMFVGWHAPVL